MSFPILLNWSVTLHVIVVVKICSYFIKIALTRLFADSEIISQMPFNNTFFGAKKIGRIKKGYRAALLLDACFAVLAFVIIETMHTQISSLFLGKDGTALAYQMSGDYMRWLGYFFIFMGIKMATDGVLRGLGNMRPFLIANMVNLAIRLSVALILAPRFGIAFV